MILIKNGRILNVLEEKWEDKDILLDGDKIKSIEDEIEDKGYELIDAKGKLITPGLIDAHCHLGLDEDAIGFEGADYNESVDPITPHLRAIDSINPMDRTLEEAYQGGVTTVNTGQGSANVMGGSFVAIKTHGHRVDDMIVKYPTGLKIAFGENPKRVYKSQGKSPITRMAVAGLLRETLYKAKDYMKKKDEGKDIDYDIKMESILPVLKREIPLKAHAHRADDIFTAIRIAKEFNVKVTLDHCTEGHLIAKDIAKEGYPAIVGPSFGHRTKFELKNTDFKTPNVLEEEGVLVCITTDSPVIPVHHLPMCAGLAVGSGMDEMKAFKAITINPAKVIGIDDRVGSLEVGKDADLVIFDGHPLRDLNYRVEKTIIDGKIVHKG